MMELIAPPNYKVERTEDLSLCEIFLRAMSLLDFSKQEAKKNADHTGFKEILVENKRFRIVEYEENASHPDWCTTGHVGFVLDGEIMYELEKGQLRVQKGKGFFLPTGTAHRGHNVFPGVTRFFLIDE